MTSTGSAMGTTVGPSWVGSMMTELAASAVGGPVGCAALAVATLAPCGTVVVGGGGAGGVPSVSVLVAGVADVAPLAAAASLLRGASVAVDASDDIEHVPDVVGAVAMPPSVVLPDGTVASVAPVVHEVSVAAVDMSVAASVPTAVVDVSDDTAHVSDVVGAVAVPPSAVVPDGIAASVALVVHEESVVAGDLSVAASVLTAVVVVSVEDDGVSVDGIKLAESGSVAVTSEGVSDAPAVVSDICALPVTSALVVVMPISAWVGAALAEGIAVSTVWSGGSGTSAALAGAVQFDAAATPTIKTAVPRTSRSSLRR